VGTVIAADAAPLASPSGEVEGERKMSQANMENDETWWPQEAVGVVGLNCRNKFYCEVKVAGKWAKAAKAGRSLWQGERVEVRLVWVSGDGRDAEYEVVGVLEAEKAPGQPVQAPPVGFKEQGNVGVAHQVAVVAEPVAEAVVAEEPPVEEVEAGPASGDYIDRIREEAYNAYLRTAY